MSSDNSSSGLGCGTLVGWGTMLGGVAALITALLVLWEPRDKSFIIPPPTSSPTTTPTPTSTPTPIYPRSPEEDSGTRKKELVDPVTLVQGIGRTREAAEAYYSDKDVFVRYDIKVDASTIKGNTISSRLNYEDFGEISITCKFSEEYDSEIQQLKSELFQTQATYTLGLEGYLKNVNRVAIYSSYSGVNGGRFGLDPCKIININRSG